MEGSTSNDNARDQIIHPPSHSWWTFQTTPSPQIPWRLLRSWWWLLWTLVLYPSWSLFIGDSLAGVLYDAVLFEINCFIRWLMVDVAKQQYYNTKRYKGIVWAPPIAYSNWNFTARIYTLSPSPTRIPVFVPPLNPNPHFYKVQHWHPHIAHRMLFLITTTTNYTTHIICLRKNPTRVTS